MGKGDKKSKRGKIAIGSYGVRRPKRKQNKVIIAAPQSEEPDLIAKKKTKTKEVKPKKQEVAEAEAAPPAEKTKTPKTTKKKITKKKTEETGE
ncbi:MAG: 30S ribosomal protein THX [Bacteroidales bacterium]|nr:30S ribosomal protein THX [Bacteroidales bacterium]